MTRVFFLTCSPPFFHRGKPASVHIDYAMNLFSSLLVDIKNLESSLSKHSLSLQWCLEAINLLKKMHLQILEIFQKSEVRIMFWDGGNYLDDYMEETSYILDFFNLLRSAISATDRYRIMVSVAVKRFSDLGSSSSDMNMAEIERLETEYMKLYGIANWKNVNLSKGGMLKRKNKDNIFCAVYLIRRTMNIVCSLLFSAIFYPVSIEVDDEACRKFSLWKPFSLPLRRLVCLFEGQPGLKYSSKPDLSEAKMVERAVEDLKSQVLKDKSLNDAKSRRSIDSLENGSLALKIGLEMFDSAVNELFQEVVTGRNKILGMVASNACKVFFVYIFYAPKQNRRENRRKIKIAEGTSLHDAFVIIIVICS